jgi:hypothetical protein
MIDIFLHKGKREPRNGDGVGDISYIIIKIENPEKEIGKNE